MPVSAQETTFHHVGNGVTVTFAYGCKILQASDLRVYLGDQLMNTGFTVSGIGVLTGGTVTFDAPPANQVQVRIEREITLERLTDYQQNGDFLAKVVNPDFDRLWMALQQLVFGLGRTLRIPKADPSPISELPVVAARANKLLSFDEQGNPVAVAPAAQSATALQALLAAMAGSGLIGYDDGLAYPPGTMGRTLASTLKGEDGRTYRFFCYVVRNDGTGWKYIDDIDHRPTNMFGLSVEGDILRVNYLVEGVRVSTHLVATDETMSALGVTCGASVGLTFSDIKMYMPFACWVEFIGGAWRFGLADGINPWFGPGTDTTIATSPDGSQFTITHKTASGSHPPTFAVLTQAAADAPGCDIRMSYGGTSVIGDVHAPFEGYVAWVGPGLNDWSVTTPNIAKPTFAFNAGVLTVTHENLGPDTKAVFINGVSGVYLPATGTNVTGTTFQVTFQDYAGANVAVPNANMKFRYMRPRNVKSKASEGMRVAVQRGPVQLNPAKVVSINGNLWAFGLVETE